MNAAQQCDLGVGCDEAGVCYAQAHGEPDRCGKPAEPLFDDYDDADEPIECPACLGEAPVLGRLGRRIHYRCRDCGAQGSIEA